MKLRWLGLVVVMGVGFCGCANQSGGGKKTPPAPAKTGNDQNAAGAGTDQGAAAGAQGDNNKPASTEGTSGGTAGAVTTNAPATPTPPAKTQYPKGIPVPGKPGYVKSPYAQDSGYVDVRGFPAGTEVKCPYTQKIFIVP